MRQTEKAVRNAAILILGEEFDEQNEEELAFSILPIMKGSRSSQREQGATVLLTQLT